MRRSPRGELLALAISVIATRARAQALPEPLAPFTRSLTSIRMQIPFSQLTYKEKDRLTTAINLFSIMAGHQRGPLLVEAAAGVSYVDDGQAARSPDLAARVGVVPLHGDTRRRDPDGSPLGWLVQAELFGGYRYLRFPRGAVGSRLNTLVAIDAAYFAGGDGLGLSVRLAAGLTWAPWDPEYYKVFKDVGIALGVIF